MNLTRDDRFKQGIFKPKNTNKFLGKFAIYRSSYELRFMRWADNNPNILEWNSEKVVVPYVSPIDSRGHRYYVDFYIALKEGDKIVKYLIEVKPSTQTQAPKISKRKKSSTIVYEQTTWITNQAKWSAATEYAKKRGLLFKVITEKDLGI